MNEPQLRLWMERLGPAMLAHSVGICRDRHRAEEIVQEAFVRLWRDPPDAGEVAFGAWMRKVVTNLSINCLMRTRRPLDLADVVERGDSRSLRARVPRPEEELLRHDQQERLEQALNRLDEPKRAILMLRGVEQLSYESIAEHLGVPVGTVMSRLNRARAALQEEMDRLDAADALPAAIPIRPLERRA